MKTLALDIDGTWTLDPELFHRTAHSFLSAGWKVIIVTGSQQPQEKLHRLGVPLSIPVIVSSGMLKEEAARKQGYLVSVWVDDMPGMIQRCPILGESSDHEL